MNKNLIFIILMFCLVVSGCNDSGPECGTSPGFIVEEPTIFVWLETGVEEPERCEFTVYPEETAERRITARMFCFFPENPDAPDSTVFGRGTVRDDRILDLDIPRINLHTPFDTVSTQVTLSPDGSTIEQILVDNRVSIFRGNCFIEEESGVVEEENNESH